MNFSSPFTARESLLEGRGLMLLMALSSPLVSAAQSSEAPCTVLTGARLIDSTGSSAIEDAVLVLEGDRIAMVGNRALLARVPEGVRVLDVKRRYHHTRPDQRA